MLRDIAIGIIIGIAWCGIAAAIGMSLARVMRGPTIKP